MLSRNGLRTQFQYRELDKDCELLGTVVYPRNYRIKPHAYERLSLQPVGKEWLGYKRDELRALVQAPEVHLPGSNSIVRGQESNAGIVSVRVTQMTTNINKHIAYNGYHNSGVICGTPAGPRRLRGGHVLGSGPILKFVLDFRLFQTFCNRLQRKRIMTPLPVRALQSSICTQRLPYFKDITKW